MNEKDTLWLRLICLCSIIGVALGGFFLKDAAIDVIVWNILPYIIAPLLLLAIKKYLVVMLGIVSMLFIDSWMYIEIFFEFKTPALLAISLLSTMKLVTIFPVGLVLGYVVTTYLAR